MIFPLTLAVMLAALSSLSISMDRHAKAVLGKALSKRLKLIAKLCGWGLIIIGVMLAENGYDFICALVALTIAAIVLVLVFAYLSHWFLYCITGGMALCVSGFLWMAVV